MKFVQYKKQQQRGFTLVETLVAITVLLVAIVGPMTIATRGLQTAFYARERVTALSLAQEGVELVRALRDANALHPTPSQNNELTDGLVGLWSLDNADVIGTVAYDRSGHANNHAGLVNTPAPAQGKIGQGLRFSGGNDKMIIPHPADGSLNFGTGSFSYGMWVKATVFNGPWDMVWWKGGSSAGTPGFDIELGGGAWMMWLADTSVLVGGAITNDASQLLGQWVHIFGVVDRSQNRFYVYRNGVRVSSVNISGLASVTNSNNVSIQGNLSNTYPFTGTLDDIRVYNRALSATEVQQLYDLGNESEDVDWLTGIPGVCGSSSDGCGLDARNSTMLNCNSDDCRVRYDAGSLSGNRGFYTHTTGTLTPFTRNIWIDPLPGEEEAEVTVEVSWQSGLFGGEKKVTLRSRLLDHYEGYFQGYYQGSYSYSQGSYSYSQGSYSYSQGSYSYSQGYYQGYYQSYYQASYDSDLGEI